VGILTILIVVLTVYLILVANHWRNKTRVRMPTASEYAQVDGVPVHETAVLYTPTSELRELYATDQISPLEFEQMTDLAVMMEDR
jgi:hypothetical protein